MTVAAVNVPVDLWSDPRPEEMMQCLERRRLDGLVLAPAPLFGQLDGTDFVRVKAMGRFRGRLDEAPEHWYQAAEDLVGGLHGLGVDLAYLLVGGADGVAIYLGLRGARKYGPQGDTLLHTALSGLFPGIRLDDSPGETHRLGQRLMAADLFAFQGALTGIPTLKRASEDAPPGWPWDGLLQALGGAAWGCFILARPVPMQQVVEVAELASEARRVYSFHAREQRQKGPGVTVEVEGGPAHDALAMIQRTQERLQLARAQGMWATEVHFFAPEEVTVRKLASLLCAAFAGEDSRPEPVRALLCFPGAGGSPEPPVTVLTAGELATLAQLPREERPGYPIRELARFDVALSRRPSGEAVRVGRVLDGVRDTGQVYAVERASLAKHALVAGVTGSGKTNTCFQLLDQVWQHGRGVPFLVIEPAKTEYRDLLKARDQQGKLAFPGLRVFTPGSERVAPFRLNPFELVILDAGHGIHVQTHIDQLKSIFNASFVMYAPMPYVLERCLHEVYRDRGWDLASGENRRLPAAQGKPPPEAFPTLTDLYNKIAEVVDALGYDEKIRRDVKAALQTRINSLRLGGKGLMLDTRQSVGIEELLSRPTVLELESIGDDEEKAFVIGLFLSRLYEYRVVQARQWRTLGQTPPALQHLTLVEEAHRLLRHVPPEAHPDVANVRGKAVEAFANMLAEIRAYGEGIIVAEQIPAKLAPDVVKNTNLKVVHRLVARDDRELVGGTMNLDEAQERFVTTLDTGQAAVFAEGDDRPFLVAVDEHPAARTRGQSGDQDVIGLMQGFCTGPLYAPHPTCPSHCRALAAAAGRCPHHLRDRGRALANQALVQRGLGVWVVSTVEAQDQFATAYQALLDSMRRLTSSQPRDHEAVFWCAITHGLDLFFEGQMRRYDWRLNVASSLKVRFLAVAAALHHHPGKDPNGRRQAVAGHADALGRFCRGYGQQCARDTGPHVGCDSCVRKCLYRYEVEAVVGDRLLSNRLLEALRGRREGAGAEAPDRGMWQQVRQVCLEAARQAIVSEDEGALRRVAVCYAAQSGAALGFSPAAQARLAGGVAGTARLS